MKVRARSISMIHFSELKISNNLSHETDSTTFLCFEILVKSLIFVKFISVVSQMHWYKDLFFAPFEIYQLKIQAKKNVSIIGQFNCHFKECVIIERNVDNNDR